MKISQQRPNQAKFKSGRDKYLSLAGMRHAFARLGGKGCGFQSPHHGGSDSNNPPPLSDRAIDRIGARCANRIAFPMQMNIGHPLHMQRRKRAQPNMERDPRNLDPRAASSSNISGVKCNPAVAQHGTPLPCKNSLITLAILRLIVAANIRWQGI